MEGWQIYLLFGLLCGMAMVLVNIAHALHAISRQLAIQIKLDHPDKWVDDD